MIGIISRTEGEGSGAEIVLCHLLSHWDQSVPVIVITAKGSSVAKAAREAGVPLLELAFVPYKIWPNFRTVEKSLGALKKVKLFHAWNAKSFELGWYLSRRLRVPLTCTMHDHPRSFYFTAKKLWLLKRIANSAKGVVVVSNALGDECRLHGYRRKLTTIYNGLPGDSATHMQRLDDSPIRIGFLGMSSPVKGFEIVSKWICATAANNRLQWQLYGTVCPGYQAILDSLEAGGFRNYELKGRRRPEEIFAEIDLLLHASTSFDCLPTVLLEAARAGVPVLASSCGGAKEIVRQNQTGYLFDPAQAKEGLQRLHDLLNPAVRRRFAENAKKQFEGAFRVSNMVSRYKTFWQQILTHSN